jgi:hypothetical protein
MAITDLATQVGWLAIDAERRTESRRYLHEAIARPRIIDDPRHEVRALACLSLLTRETQPKESRQCVEAAQRTSAGWATPRLRTLLHLRAAHAYANQQDASACGREVAKARTHLDRGLHEDDLPFLRFVTAQEAAGLEGLAHLALSRPERAAAAFRTIIETPDPAHRRNQVYYQVRLAHALHRQGDLHQAALVALAALPGVTGLKSERTSRLLARFRADLGAHRRSVPEVRTFTDAYDEAVAR